MRMTTIYLGLLVRGPRFNEWDEKPDELSRLQAAHQAHIEEMLKTGKAILAGPLTDDGFLRGALLFRAEALDEAAAFATSDPSIQAGRFVLEIHPWMVQAGVLPGT
jgi:uncharacterized protein YciI